MKDPLRHLPCALVAFIVLLIGFVDLAMHAEWNTLVTLLAPILWLGMYFALGADRAQPRHRGPEAWRCRGAAGAGPGQPR